MSTVKFSCPHCRHLMAVVPELLGRQVRCPHCQQILTAPVTDPTQTAVTEVTAFPAIVPGSSEQAAGTPPESADESPFTGADPQRASPQERVEGESRARSSVPRPRTLEEVARRNNLVLAILVPYSVFMTVAAITYFVKFQNQAQIHPLEMIPDLIGEFQRKQAKGSAQTVTLPPPDQDLPRKLVTSLGRALTVGAVEVTPLSIEYRPWAAYTKEKNQGEAVKHPVRDTLVLRLRLRNVSPDLTFYPTDPYFDRRPKHVND